MRVNNIHCRCTCGFRAIQPEILPMVLELEWVIKLPITVMTMCRCPTHNLNEGGSNDSGHMGYYEISMNTAKWTNHKLKYQEKMVVCAAVDCTCRNNKKLFKEAKKMEWNGVIWYPKKNFVHLDLKPRKNPFYRIIE